MKKLIIIILLIVGINKSFSQITNVEIITKENDTLKYTVTTKQIADYGNLKINIANAKRFPF